MAFPGECGDRPWFRTKADVRHKLPGPQNVAGGKEQPQGSAWLMHAAPSSTTERRELGHACYGVQTARIALDYAKNLYQGVLQTREICEHDLHEAADAHMGITYHLKRPVWFPRAHTVLGTSFGPRRHIVVVHEWHRHA
jgi:hypothetical protein